MSVLLLALSALAAVGLAYRRELVTLYGEITHPDGRHEVWGTPKGEIAKWVTVGACAFLGGGGALGLAIMGGKPASGTPPVGFSYSAPNTPTGTVVVIDTSTVYFLASAFVGSGDDTQDSVRFAVTRLAADTTAILTEVKTATTTNARDTISDNTNLKADTTYRGWFKYSGVNGNWSAWSAPDTFVNTVAVAGQFDPFLPAAWTDTIQFDEMNDTAGTTTASWGGGEANISEYLMDRDQNVIHGSGITPFSVVDRLIDSISTTGMASAPWVWEARRASGSGGGSMDTHLSFSNGNGSGTSGNARVYIRVSFVYEGDNLCASCVDYEQEGSDKVMRLEDDAQPLLDWWDNTLAVVNSGGDSGSCGDTYANTWELYYPADTAGAPGNGGLDSNCPAKGHMIVEPGVPMHLWMCIDSSPANGSEVISWGMTTPTQEGIAGYYADRNINETWTGFYIDTTYGGSGTSPFAQSMFVDEIFVATGTSGSCVVPS